MRRGATALAIVAVAGGLLAGCGSGPSQIGSAAIVGDTAIPLEYIQDWFDRVVANRERKEQLRSQGQFDDLGRFLVTETVRHELLNAVVAREGMTFNEQQVSEQVSELLDQLGGPEQVAQNTVYDETTIRQRARDQLLALELGKKYFETTTVTFDYTQATSRAQAEAKARELAADPGKAGSIVEQDIRNGQQAGLDQRLVMAEEPQTAAQLPLFSVPAGNVVAFPLGDASGQWLVAHVRERDTDDSSASSGSGSGNATSADRVDPRLMEQIGLRLLAPLAAEIGVKINPRYGVWDPVSLEAVQTEGETRAIVVPVRQPTN
jgi:hypothetical protein